MSDRHYTDLPMHLPPPEPPKLMKLTISGGEEPVRTFHDVTASALVGPSTFRFETLDGKIRLFDMTGRDFLLVPQEASDV